MIDWGLIIAIVGAIGAWIAALAAILPYLRRARIVVNFSGDKDLLELKPNENVDLKFMITNIGKSIAENVIVHLYFPPEFNLNPPSPLGLTIFRVPSSTGPIINEEIGSVQYSIDSLHPKYEKEVELSGILTPKERGLYKVQYSSTARVARRVDKKLKIEIRE